MTHTTVRRITASALALAYLTAAPGVMAVGSGLNFLVDEGQIPNAFANFVPADSMDFTYHACVDFVAVKRFRETGYFWVSSYQDADSEVDSQINHIQPNGYRIYGVYKYKARQVGQAQPTPSGTRLNYVATSSQPSIELFLDPEQNTTLSLQNCQVQGVDDDISLGSCNTIAVGEKSETDGLANGDFKIVFGEDWNFTPEGQALFGNPAEFNYLIFNGNITDLGGPLGMDHMPEGSGNLFWVSSY